MIYFVRHGQTDWNLLNKCQGLVDIPINKTGEEQAKQVKESLKNVNIDLCLCSPLLRARQTFKIIFDREPKKEEIDQRLIERDLGEFEGKTRNEFDFKAFNNLDNDGNYKSAEDISSVLDRAKSLYHELEKVKDKNVLLISHGGFGVVFCSLFLKNKEIKDFTTIEMRHGEAVELSFD